MGYTVALPIMTKDSEFEAYARLLRQTGVDLGKVPRVPEPGTDRRWLYVWDSEQEAAAFAAELTKRTRQSGWKVVKVNAPASEGPLGPLLVQLARRAEGLTIALHPLSRAVVRSAFPDAGIATTSTFIDTQTWYDFRETTGELKDLIEEILPVLTGLSKEQLNTLGYSVLDADTEGTLVAVPPKINVQG